YGKREHLKRLHPYKVRPNTDNIPNCWEWGTLNHECIAGIKACVDYWEELGRRAKPEVTTRRAAILAAHEATHEHERKMMEKMIAGLLAIPGLKLYGISDPRRFENRCATIVVRVEGHTPLELATKLGERGFCAWEDFCASAWCTTTRWRKWRDCWRRCGRLLNVRDEISGENRNCRHDDTFSRWRYSSETDSAADC